MEAFLYSLDKSSKKHICPNCNQKTFVLYILYNSNIKLFMLYELRKSVKLHFTILLL